MHKGHFLRRVEIIIGISALALLITGLTFSSIGYQHEQEIEATLSLNETALIGEKGEDGEDGAPGADGRNGTDGTTGAAGPPGPTGAAGTPGPTGAAGSPGPTGAAGSPGPTGPTGAAGAAGTPGIVTGIQIYGYRITGGEGPALTANTWTTRVLNSVFPGGNLNGVYTSLASNTVTFQPGIYRIWAAASVFGVDRNMMRIRDTTNSVTIVNGLSTFANVQNSVAGILNTTSTVNIQLQHWAQSTHSSGQGIMSAGLSESNTYAIFEIWKLNL